MRSTGGTSRSKAKAWVTDWPDERSSALSLTFDDGYSCHFKHLRPVLNKHELKATFFVVPGWLDNPGTSKYAARIGTWHDFEMLAIDEHEIGSHSVSHVNLTQLATGADDQSGTLLYELSKSKQAIEQHVKTKACTAFAFPYAVHDRKVDKNTALHYIAARGLGNPFILATSAIIGFMDLDRRIKNLCPPRNRPISLFNKWILTRKRLTAARLGTRC
jgi:peptidoglycan/xylan/chitin deacetylase (PgdA/CDA1 family)